MEGPPPLQRHRSARMSEPLPSALENLTLSNPNLRHVALHNAAVSRDGSSARASPSSASSDAEHRHKILACNSIDDFVIGKVLGTGSWTGCALRPLIEFSPFDPAQPTICTGVSSVVKIATHRASGTVVALKELDKGEVGFARHRNRM